jgi:hypothetical protein
MTSWRHILHETPLDALGAWVTRVQIVRKRGDRVSGRGQNACKANSLGAGGLTELATGVLAQDLIRRIVLL